MAFFSLGFLNSVSSSWLDLNEGNLIPSLLGASYEMKVQSGTTVQETINLRLHGSLTEMRAVVDRLQCLENTSQLASQGLFKDPVYIRFWHPEFHAWFYSRLTSLYLQSLPHLLGSRERGSLSLELHLERLNHWDSEPAELVLANTGGSPTGGLPLRNHDDSTPGHDNWFLNSLTSASNVVLPSPIRIEITNLSSTSLGDLYIGSFNMNSGSDPVFLFETESGTGGGSLSSASASGGYYSRLTWSGNSWTTINSWTFTSTQVTQCAGKFFLPLIKFFSHPTEENAEFRLLISTNGNQVYQSPSFVLPAVQDYLALSPFRLPVGDLPLEFSSVSHTLTLQARLSGTGSHTIDQDFLFLIPQEYTLHLQNVSGLPLNGVLIDDAFLEKSWSRISSLELITHLRSGSGLFLNPSLMRFFYVFQVGANKLSAIDRVVKVRAWFRDRRAVI